MTPRSRESMTRNRGSRLQFLRFRNESSIPWFSHPCCSRSMLLQKVARGNTGAVDEKSMKLQSAARGNTGAVDEESMKLQSAARGTTGAVDEESMKLQNVARGNMGAVDEESMDCKVLPGAIWEHSIRSR